jgi:hypothetical protein
MQQVVLLHRKPPEIMDIVRSLRADGLVQGVDFDFKYTPPYYDTFGYEAVHPAQTEFTFYSDKYATFFALKYGI